MPVAIWLNENRIFLGLDDWVILINSLSSSLSQIFGFEFNTIEIAHDLGGEDEIISSLARESLSMQVPFKDVVQDAMEGRHILRMVGSMTYPEKCNAFIEFYLKSSDRKTNSDVLFDTNIDSKDLLDILWERKEASHIAREVQEKIGRVRVTIQSKPRRIVDSITIAYDVPDVDNWKNDGVLLYYSSLKGESSLLDKLLRNYVTVNPEKRGKISLFKTRAIASKLYSTPEVKDRLKHFGDRVESLSGGSFAFVSKDPRAFGGMVSFLEKSVVVPSVRSFPDDAKIIHDAVEEIKKERLTEQSSLG